MKAFWLVLVIYAVVSYPLWYITYRRYDLNWAPPDSAHYIDLCQHLGDARPPRPGDDGKLPIYAQRPLCYRTLSPLLVRALRHTGLHRIYDPGTSGDFAVERQAAVPGAAGDIDPREYRLTVYYYTVLNYALLVAAAALWFVYAHGSWRLSAALSLAGGLVFLFTFYNLLQSFLPHSDAGAHLLIVASLVAYERNRPGWFAGLSLLAAWQKETILLVLGLYLALELVRGRRWALGWMLALAPGLLAYKAMTWLWPAAGKEQFDAGWQWFWNLTHIFQPGQYTPSFVLRHFVGNLTLFAALAGHAYLRLQGRSVRFPLTLLLLFPALYAVGMALTVNVGRVMSLGAAVSTVYAMLVVQELLNYRVTKIETQAGHAA